MQNILKQQSNDLVKIKGIQILRKFNLNSKAGKILEDRMLAFLSKPLNLRLAQYSYYKELLNEMKDDFLIKEIIIANLVATVGRSVIAQRLAGTTTYTGTINYGALGSSAAAVSNADTQLGTEVFRKTVASASYTTNQAFIDFFYSKADTNGTYQEFGSFIDGTGSANTGQLFSHVLTGGWTKLSSESMTVSCQYTIS